jgi:hypothetical protein
LTPTALAIALPGSSTVTSSLPVDTSVPLLPLPTLTPVPLPPP